MRAKASRGEFFIDAMIGFAALIAVAMSCMSLPELFMRKQDVDYVARTVVRFIERNGAAGHDAQLLVAELESATGMDLDVTWSGSFSGAHESIQLRNKFYVTVNYTAVIEFIKPTFSDPLVITVPLSKTVSGVSEKYWKVMP